MKDEYTIKLNVVGTQYLSLLILVVVEKKFFFLFYFKFSEGVERRPVCLSFTFSVQTRNRMTVWGVC